MIDAATRRLVRERAGNRCEYCGLHQDHSPLATLQIEHVNPRKHGGTDAVENVNNRGRGEHGDWSGEDLEDSLLRAL